MDVKGKVIL